MSKYRVIHLELGGSYVALTSHRRRDLSTNAVEILVSIDIHLELVGSYVALTSHRRRDISTTTIETVVSIGSFI